MRCPVCGAENPDDSKYCSKCLTNISGEVGEYYQAGSVYGGPGGSSSEWRGLTSTPRSDVDLRLKEKERKAKMDLAIYGVVFLVFILAIVLSLTISGNKTPTEVAEGFMQALNNKDIEAMSEYVWGSDNDATRQKMQKMIDKIGPEGSFSDLVYSSEEIDLYVAVVHLESGVYNPSGTALEKQIDESNKLRISMESQKGHWYVNIDDTFVFP